MRTCTRVINAPQTAATATAKAATATRCRRTSAKTRSITAPKAVKRACEGVLLLRPCQRATTAGSTVTESSQQHTAPPAAATPKARIAPMFMTKNDRKPSAQFSAATVTGGPAIRIDSAAAWTGDSCGEAPRTK